MIDAIFLLGTRYRTHARARTYVRACVFVFARVYARVPVCFKRGRYHPCFLFPIIIEMPESWNSDCFITILSEPITYSVALLSWFLLAVSLRGHNWHEWHHTPVSAGGVTERSQLTIVTLPSSFCPRRHREGTTDTSDTALQFLPCGVTKRSKLTLVTLPCGFCRRRHREVTTDTSDTALQFLPAASPRGHNWH